MRQVSNKCDVCGAVVFAERDDLYGEYIALHWSHFRSEQMLPLERDQDSGLHDGAWLLVAEIDVCPDCIGNAGAIITALMATVDRRRAEMADRDRRSH